LPRPMKDATFQKMFQLLFIVSVVIQPIFIDAQRTAAQILGQKTCEKPTDFEHLCYCGADRKVYDRIKGETCVKGVIVKNLQSAKLNGDIILRTVSEPLRRSLRDDKHGEPIGGLFQRRRNMEETEENLVPLLNISIDAFIDTFAADVTIKQVFVNEERNPIEAIYVFPIEENAAVYSFTAQIKDRTITAELKEKTKAEQEYKTAVSQGQTAVLLRQSDQTLDTFTINVGSLRPGETCTITIKYVSELEMVDGKSIRFVVPTTISPRYNPQLGRFQSPDGTPTKYTQKTPYSLWFEAHVVRSQQYDFRQVANLSHPVDAVMNENSIDVSMSSIALDHDIILDIDLPNNRPSALVRVEKDPQTSTTSALFAFIPRLSDFLKISPLGNATNNEFIFIVDCSGSMSAENRIPLAREAMLLFLRSLPLDSHFNIIRFGSNYDVLFKTETMTAVYNETTSKEAETMIRSMDADFGGTELLEPLKHLKQHPAIRGRSRQVFLLTDGEISNTNEVIDLCRSMSTSTRIFSIGLGDSPSRSLVKGLARATNGHFTFIPPNAKVDTYVASQFDRALQPSIVDARLEWHGLDNVGQQAPKTIPPLYINDRVLVYQLFDGDKISEKEIRADLMVGNHRLDTFTLPRVDDKPRSTMRRLAAKALIQELQHSKSDVTSELNNATKEEIIKLSLSYQILSPYTAFVGVEKNRSDNNDSHPSQVRYVPIPLTHSESMSDVPVVGFHSLPSGTRAGGGGGGGGGWGLGAAVSADYEGDTVQGEFEVMTTTFPTMPSQSDDRVRQFIDRQSFNGAWILTDKDVAHFTDGKSLSAIKVTGKRSRDMITTALAIAILESKYSGEMQLWKAVVNKARQELVRQGLTNDEVDALVDEIKIQL